GAPSARALISSSRATKPPMTGSSSAPSIRAILNWARCSASMPPSTASDDPVLLDPRVELGASDPEKARREGLVVAGFLQGVFEEAALDLLQALSRGRIRGSGILSVSGARGEVLGRDQAAVGQDDRVLDRVSKLPDVAGPGVGEQDVARLLRDPG